MIWTSWSDFFHMGGYAFYVWGSYALTTVLIAGEILLQGAHWRKVLELVRRTIEYRKIRNDESAA